MAKSEPLRCRLITPERQVLDTEAVSVIFPAHDGHTGVLVNRAPLLCELGIGVCQITTPTESMSYYIDGGFARMLDNQLTILTQEALAPGQIDADAVQRDLAEATAQSAPTLESQDHRRLAIDRARAKLHLARTG